MDPDLVIFFFKRISGSHTAYAKKWSQIIINIKVLGQPHLIFDNSSTGEDVAHSGTKTNNTSSVDFEICLW